MKGAAGSRREVSCPVIGVIHTPFSDPSKTPIQGIFSRARGTIELYKEYAPGLRHLDTFSHCLLIYHFHRAPGVMLAEKPMVNGQEPHGIFSTRHFNRPAHLGLTLVRIIRAEGNRLDVEGVDMLDETPLLDIKPFISSFDAAPGASTGWVTAGHIDQIRNQSASFQE
ncbi:MAG TPA: tRNA (N6-threonylcarbamoyladenosine(37)-N6)-methyltransferase TrmO [Methanoregulaceae archaeon]|nr:MAG: tRNA (N6-threonylcarbamoyladenosine(37)-N6)-methyltransferase TrmO [Methanolinea sp.]HON81149.1 tRNA (N6-threonylcarbamoyladenosine(37)-N6)-methyltransferase TrmO [Methanoregulaceae archaeon]HPD09907.1 tRNA (N6-threonylcarbamoyladenosine(37)-N6)-methyltransferase TrmO [Methanoregulaceae archaeon]HRT14902.1 tRNA (N6-threonylcarbamoyladenosine(37)-N6)-methyltransferase TrmO [Methanoregulaceae archaeon]HRU30483.1 tRNA (N6-threonylcarbamoyladenosine(37)-N6)-methyltransferase TrmO [Methanore